MATNSPIIAYDNWLVTGSYALQIGRERADLPIGKAFDADLLKPAEVYPVAGVLQFSCAKIANVYMRSFGVGRFGEFGFGGFLPAQATRQMVLVLGASRQDSAGFRSVPVRVVVTAYDANATATVVLDSIVSGASNRSIIYKLASCIGALRFEVRLEGLPSVALLPHIFLGEAVELPYLEMGFDPYNDVFYGSTFLAESGREYPQLRYLRMELNPRWSYLGREFWQDLYLLKEMNIEQRRPFWFAWMPDTAPSETYLMREDGKALALPFVSANHRSLAMKLVEAL